MTTTPTRSKTHNDQLLDELNFFVIGKTRATYQSFFDVLSSFSRIF